MSRKTTVKKWDKIFIKCNSPLFRTTVSPLSVNIVFLCIIAGQDDPESEDEVYEVVDLTEYARRHQWWSRVFGSNSGPIAEKYSVTTQLMMGGVTGW